MNRCAAVRKKGSTDRCRNAALINAEFCGQHARSRDPTRWRDLDPDYTRKLVLTQKMARGWLVRHRLTRAGPGVLKRSLCNNDEDLVTFDEKDRVHPWDYFGWEEEGKVWWFDVRTILQLLRGSLHPVNPYTKTPIPMEARQRARKVQFDRWRRRQPRWHSPPTREEELLVEQTTLCQLLHENGFDEIHPEHWNVLSQVETLVFLDRLYLMFRGWAMEGKPRPWRTHFANLVMQVYRESINLNPHTTRWATARILCVLFSRQLQPAELAFHIVSAFTQAVAFGRGMIF